MLVFLDIDGVMIPAKGWEKPELLDDGFPSFNSRAIHALQSIISDDTTIMLTTSHKSKYSLDEWKRIFEVRGIKIKNLEALDSNTNHLNRKEEILNWFLHNNTAEEFIIIDDDKSLNDLPAFLKNHLILTSSLIGLTAQHVLQVQEILKKGILVT